MKTAYQNSLPGPDDIARANLPNGITVLSAHKLQQPVRSYRRLPSMRQLVRH